MILKGKKLKKGRKKVVAKQYFSNRERFAEICNHGLFHGETILQADKLKELDSEEQAVMGAAKKDLEVLWKNRDILKQYEDGTVFMIVGIESQTEVHYCMPLRTLMYDTLNYEAQRTEIYQKHKRNRDLQGAEYMSGFSKYDRLRPVFTLVLYYGEKEWDGAKALMELLDIPAELMPFKDKLLDCKLNLLDVRRIENLEEYSDELRALFGFMKYEKDKSALLNYVDTNSQIFNQMPVETARAISVLADVDKIEHFVNRRQKEGKGTVNMCQALRDMENEARNQGRLEGMKKGEKRGERKGKAIERENGIRNLIEDNMEEGVERERILGKLIKRYHLDQNSAEMYYTKFAV